MRNPTAPARDRRGVARPRNGDTRSCVRCGGRAEFSERYRIEGHLVPAWVCDTPGCREWDLVRAAQAASAESASRIRDAREVRGKARRAATRTRARIRPARLEAIEKLKKNG